MINVRMEQHPYYFLKELKQVLLDAGFVVDGKYALTVYPSGEMPDEPGGF